MAIALFCATSVAYAADDKDALIREALSAASPEIAQSATVMDWDHSVLKKGTGAYTCMPTPADVRAKGGREPMCLDKAWEAWGAAWMNKKDPPKPKAVGVAYMLKGDKGASNTDPYATKATADNHWVVSGPHIMLLPTDASQLDAYPTDWTKGGPWVMWKGTPYAHVMVPTTATPKSASK